ncbi:hypothetical protein Q5P01_010192 [Channa striata]|uniref:Ig-like domain-containing protein n=1 Tax=Channa striata TaxID=64152 RepID=A0AA88SQA3_CHASR|nr:hypothetical protein Q5P01_010192 [Channa striata]
MAGRNAGYLLVGLAVLLHTWRGWAVEVNMEDRVEVLRGDTVPITCMFKSDDGIGGLEIQWFYVTRSGERQSFYYQDATMKEVKRGTPFTDRISVKDSATDGLVVLTISNVKLDDQLEFICLVKTLTEGIAEGHTMLKVFEAPDHPTIEGVETGILVSDNPSKIGVCEVKNGFPKPNITWYKNDMPLRATQGVVEILPSSTVHSSGLVSATSELKMKVTKEDNKASFYCEVNFFYPGGTKMTETRRIEIDVHYPSTTLDVWVESPKGKIKEGDSIEIRCRGDGNHESLVSIYHNNVELSVTNDTLVLHNVTRLASGDYICNSLDLESNDELSGHTTVFVHYLNPAVIEPKGPVILHQGETLTATCNALSSLNTSTVWFKNQDVFFIGHTLVLKDASLDTAGTYTCLVSVPEIDEMQTSGSLHVNVLGPPKIRKEDNTEIEESFESTVELTCFVRGFPAPNVTWTTLDGKVFKTVSQTESEEGVKSMVSIKVTSDSTVFCKASNELGDDDLAFTIKATKHTVITTSASTTTTTTTPTTAPTSSSSRSSSRAASADTATISPLTVKPETAIPPKKFKKEGNGVVIAVIIICILLLAILGSVLYFLYKTGKICGRSGKQDLTKEKSNKDNIVVEMKSDNTEEAILLGVNGEKQLSSDQ